MKTRKALFLIPYLMWIILFVILPILLILWYSFTDSNRSFTLNNYAAFFRNSTFLRMMLNSCGNATLITKTTPLISFPPSYLKKKKKNQQLWLLLIILPTWINLLLKAYAFIGILGNNGLVNKFLQLFGIGPVNILFTDFAFIFVATYIEIPFMILPIFNAIKEIDPAVIQASEDLGASRWQTFTYVLWPLSRPGVESGVQAIFIPSLSLFMLTRLIGGNRVITLGTAIEEYFMTTMNWNMGATIGVILIVLMVIAMLITSRKARRKKVDL